MTRPRASWGLAVALGLAALLVIQLLWLDHFRFGFVTEYDESGYLALALDDAAGLRDDGPAGLVRAMLDEATQPPAVPASAVPALIVAGDSVGAGLVTISLWLVALGAATYWLARAVVAPRWAALATLAVVTAPQILDYSRLFHFSVPATAAFTVAAACLLRSDGFRLRRWAVAGGAALAVMVLSRSMTLSFLPAFAAVAVLWLVADPADRPRRMAGMALAGVTAAVLAGLWYVPNARGVGSYLLGYGYGAESDAYGDTSLLSLARLTREAGNLVRALYVPLAVTALVAALAGLAAARGRRDWRAIALAPATALAVLVAEGYVAVTSSRNVGTAFTMPWTPALLVLCVAGAAAARPAWLRTGLATAFAAFGLLSVAWKSLDWGVVHRAVVIGGDYPVLDGASVIWREVAGSGYDVGPRGSRLPDLHRDWLDAAAGLVADNGTGAIAVGTDDPLLSGTRMRLASRLDLGHSLDTVTLRPFPDGDTVAAYREQISDANATTVLTGELPPGVQGFGITRSTVEEAARELGYRPDKTTRLPDGRAIVAWRRP